MKTIITIRKEVVEMSALVVGKGSHIGAMSEVLLRGGFGSVYFQNSVSFRESDLAGYGGLDLLILVKEVVKEGDIGNIFKEAVRLDIPVVLW